MSKKRRSRKPGRPAKTRRARIDPGVEQALHDAIAQHRQGDFQRAEAAFRAILKTDRTQPVALTHLGIIRREAGDPPESIELLRRAFRIETGNRHIGAELARSYLAAGELVAARKTVDALISGSPDAGLYALRAEIHEQHGRFSMAIDDYAAAIAIDPGIPELHNNLGLLRRQIGDYRRAIECFDRAIEQRPESLSALNNKANACCDIGDFDTAVACLDAALDLNPTATTTLFNLAVAQQKSGRLAAAKAAYEQLLDYEPNDTRARLGRVEILLSEGDFDEAATQLDALTDDEPRNMAAWFLKTTIDRFDDDDIDRLAAITDDGLSEEWRVFKEFALARMYERAGTYERAYGHYRAGNALKARDLAGLQHRDAADARALRVLPVDQFEPSTKGAQRRLLFIVGMPRSGTTLIEQVLSRHPHVTALGELDFFDQALIRFGHTKTVSGSIVDAITSASEESLEQIRAAFFARIDRHTSRTDTTVVEKTPANFMFLGLINRLFPNAKVIHCRRNPMDTCLSIFFQLFSTGNFYAYEPATIVAMYGAYRDLMDHWSHSLALEIHDLDYESFVQAREEQTRVLLDFCGLRWDPQCLAPDTTDGPVTTASRWQVRQPVTTARIERWRNYEPFVDEFKRRLEGYLG